MKHYDSKFNYKERNEEIYHKREVEKRTLKSVGDEYGLSIGRIRGITARVHRMKFLEKEMESRCLNPKVMGDIQWNSVRVKNCFTYYHYHHDHECSVGSKGVMGMSIEEFIKNFNYHKLMRVPNFGRKTLLHVCERLEDHGYKDIEHLRSAKNCNRRELEKAAAYGIVKAMTL